MTAPWEKYQGIDPTAEFGVDDPSIPHLEIRGGKPWEKYTSDQDAPKAEPPKRQFAMIGRGNFFTDIGDAYLAHPDKSTTYGAVLPLAREADGTIRPAAPQLVQDFARALSAPGRAASGQLPLFDEQGNVTPMAEEAANAAGAISLGGGGATAFSTFAPPAGAFSMNAIRRVPQAARTATRAASAVVQPIIDRFDPNGAAGRILAKRIMQQNPGMSFEDAIKATEKRLAELGPDAVIADTGKATQNLARLTVHTPGETSQRAETVLGARAVSEPTMVGNSVKANVSSDDFYDAKDAAKKSKQLAGPYYEAANEAFPNVTSPELRSVLKSEPLIKEGINKGLELRRIERSDAILRGESTEPFDPKTFRERIGWKENWDPIYEEHAQTPLELWHAAREGLDDMLEVYRDKTTGKLVLDKRGERIKDLRASLNAMIKKNAGGDEGDFAKADKIYADASRLGEALDKGRGFMRGDEEVTDKFFAGLSPEEQNAYRIGVGREIVAMARKNGTTPATLMAATKDTGLRDKLKIILPTEDQFNAFIKDLDKVQTFRETNAIRRGSQTHGLGAEDRDVNMEAVGDIAHAGKELIQGNFGAATASATRSALNFLKRAQIPQESRDTIGRLLVSQDPKDKEEAFKLLRETQSSGWTYVP